MSGTIDGYFLQLGIDPSSVKGIAELTAQAKQADQSLAAVVRSTHALVEAQKSLAQLSNQRKTTGDAAESVKLTRQIKTLEKKIAQLEKLAGDRDGLPSQVKLARQTKQSSQAGIESIFSELAKGRTNAAELKKLAELQKLVMSQFIKPLETTVKATEADLKKLQKDIKDALAAASKAMQESRADSQTKQRQMGKQDGLRAGEGRKQRQMDAAWAEQERQRQKQKDAEEAKARKEMADAARLQKRELEKQAKAETAQYGTEASRRTAERARVRDSQLQLLQGFGQKNPQASALVNYQAQNNPQYIRHLATVAGKASKAAGELGYTKQTQEWAEIQQRLKTLLDSLNRTIKPSAGSFSPEKRREGREGVLQGLAANRFTPRAGMNAYELTASINAQRTRTTQFHDLALKYPNSARAQRFFADEKAALERAELALREFKTSIRPQQQLSGGQLRRGYQEGQIDTLSRRRFTNMPANSSVADMNLYVKAQETRVARAYLATQARPGSGTAQQVLAAEQQALKLAQQRSEVLRGEIKAREKLARQQHEEGSVEAANLRLRQFNRMASPEHIRQRTIIQARQSDDRFAYDGGASLFRTQLGLLQNYALMGAGVGGVATTGQFMAELDKEMKQLQAIVALTNTEMAVLEDRLVSVSEKTKFTAVEVTQAAVILGQAGLGKDAIADSIEGITLFASAVGSDLSRAVDIATSTLGVYNIEAERMPDVVDKLTTAVNKSKLNLDKLTLGIQYAGNMAYQSNVTFEDTVAVLGAMANSGIRSGSTLGTGLSQVLLSLQKPSEEFLKITKSLGLSLYDLDLNAHGLVGVLKNLANAGFTVRDAMRSMEKRGASAYGAVANNIDMAEELVEAMAMGGAASAANEIQMQSFSNTLAQTTSIFKTFVAEGLDPLLHGLTAIIKAGGSFVAWLREIKAAGPVFTGLMSGAAMYLVMNSVKRLGLLIASLRSSSLWNGGAPLGAGAGGAAAGAGARAGLGSMARIAGRAALGFAGGPWGVAAMAGGAALYEVYDSYGKQESAVDQATAALNENQAQLEKNEFWSNKLARSMDDLYYKQFQLTEASGAEGNLKRYIEQLNAEFKDLGLYLDSSSNSFDDVTAKLREFREQVLLLGQSGRDERGGLLLQGLEDQLAANMSGKYTGWAENLIDMEADPELLRKRSQSQRSFYGQSYDSLMDTDRTLNVGAATFKTLREFKPGESDPEALSRAISSVRAEQARLIQLANLPDAEFQARAAEAGLTTKRANGRDVSVPYLVEPRREQLKESLDNFDLLLGDLEKTFELATQFETYRKGEPQKEAAQISELEQTFSEQLAKALADQGIAQANNEKVSGSDTVASYEGAKQLRIEAEERAEANEQTIRQYIEKNFGIFDKVMQNQLMEKAGLNQSNNQLVNASVQNFEMARERAKPEYMMRLQARQSAVAAELGNLQASAEDGMAGAERAALKQQIEGLLREQASLEYQIKEFNMPFDPEARVRGQVAFENQAQLQSNLDKNNQYFGKLSAYDEAYAGFERGEFPIGDNSKALNKEVRRAMKDWWSARQSELDAQLTTELSALDSKKGAIDSQQRKLADSQTRFGDGGLPIDERVYASGAVETDIFKLSKLNDQLVLKQIEAYQRQSAAVAETLKMANERIASGRLAGQDKAQTERLKADAEKTLAENNKKVGELNLQMAENRLNTLDQVDELRNNTKALERSERRYRSEEFERKRVDLYGGRMETDSGEVYEKTPAQDMSEVAANAGDSMGKAFIDAYDGAEPLVGILDGMNQQIADLGANAGSAFAAWVTGAQDADDAMRSMATNMAQYMAELAAQQAMGGLLNMIGQAAMSYFGGSTITPGASNSSYNPAGMTGSFGGGYYHGGMVYGGAYANGGPITSGTRAYDSTWIKARKGEFVLRPEAVDALGVGTVTALNALDRNALSSGDQLAAGSRGTGAEGEGEPSVTNIWVVLPEEQPQSLGASDVLVTVQDDIRRGGVTRRLIKQIVEKR